VFKILCQLDKIIDTGENDEICQCVDTDNRYRSGSVLNSVSTPLCPKIITLTT
jgi:hypothetical protein